MLELAESAQLGRQWAAARIDAMLDVATDVSKHLDTPAIRQASRRLVAGRVAANVRLLAETTTS